MIIFNKEEHYNELINNGFEKFPNKRDLIILARHWYEKDNIYLSNIKINLINFCLKYNTQFNPIKCENLLIKVVESLEHDEIKDNFKPRISLFKEEILYIKNIKSNANKFKWNGLKNNKKWCDYLQRLLFVMLCISKWKNYTPIDVSDNNIKSIYITSTSPIKLKQYFELARIKFTKKQQVKALFELNNMGLINVNLRPLLRYDILFSKNNGELVKEFTINKDMIDVFDEVIGENYVECERCHKKFEKNSNRQKYCKNCANIVKKEQKLNYWKEKTRTLEKK